MATVNQNDQASAAVMNTALNTLSTSGQDSLTTLLDFKEVNLLSYQNVESYINSRRVLATRVKGAGIPLTVSAGDFQCIDQGLTTGSIRADSGVITTKETSIQFTELSKFAFSSSTGSITPIDSKQSLYTVIANTVPVGQFDITLNTTSECSLVTFDVLANPQSSKFQVFVSFDKLTYTEWTQVAVNGYRVTAFGQTANTNYIRIVITPGSPDLLSGTSYSFGLTSLTVRSSQFALRSEFNSRPITINPTSSQLYFGGDTIAGITYYLSVSIDGTGEFLETPINTVIQLPTASAGTGTVAATVISGLNQLSLTLPANLYLPSLSVQETLNSITSTLTIFNGLQSTDPNLNLITNDCLYIKGTNLILVTTTGLTGKTFTYSYKMGPAQMIIKVRAVLDTTSYGSTPMFKQVYFEEI